jgi:serine/threonine protein kinase
VASAPLPTRQSHGISETAFSPRYFEKFFVEERELGRGGKGVVVLVKHVLDGVTLGHFACKRVPIGDDHAWLEKVLIEVQLLQGLSHQNLVSYRHVWLEDYQISPFGPSVPCAFILQQYCNGGDMHNYVLGDAQATTTTQELKERLRRRSRGEAEAPRRPNEPKRLQFDEIYNFFRDITSGLRFLHHNNFIHRDLKPSNCLLHTTGGETRVLVSDFGEVQYEYATRKSTGATGTISYCAPEVLRRISPGGPFENFTSKSDIFSLGMILHFLCFSGLPYRYADVLHEEREDVDELRAEIMRWEGFDDQRKQRPELPAALYTFLKRLLSLDPDQRPSADDVLQVVSSGRLDDFPAVRRRNSLEPEELTPGRRIQKLDTPQKGNSPQRGLGLDLDGKPSRSLFRSAISRSPERSKAGAAEQGSSSSGSDDADQTPPMRRTSSLGLSRARPDVPTSGRVFLRSSKRHASSVSVPTSPTPLSAHDSILPRPEQLLLADTAAGGAHGNRQHLVLRLLDRLSVWMDQPITSTSVRMVILGLKLLSTLQPCLSHGINAAIVYPMICFALLEFSMANLRRWQAGSIMAIHFAVLALALRTNNLCRSPKSLLAWDAGEGF